MIPLDDGLITINRSFEGRFAVQPFARCVVCMTIIIRDYILVISVQ